MAARKTFFIIDGHAQIYRAYFAPFRDLSSPSGEPTKATFVFTQWLINLVLNRKPDYLAMVIDHGYETVFRKEILPEYKANRESPPDDFYPQEKRILQIVRDAGIPVFVQPGFEADDIIATLARKMRGKGLDLFIASRDKDLRQLIDGGTKMYDMQADTVIDRDQMIAQVGYAPEQAIDVQTLMGDSIDNVPGIPGVGEKTAAKLIATYGNVDGVLKNLDKLTPKLRENFQNFSNRLPISRQLVTLKNDIEMEFDIEQCVCRGIDSEAMRTDLHSLGFTTLVKRLGGNAEPVATAAPKIKVKAPTGEVGLFGSMDAPHPKGAGSQKHDPAPPTNKTIDPFSGGAQPHGFLGTQPQHSGNEAEKIAIPIPPETFAGCDYRLVQTPDQFQTFLSELRTQPRFAFDTETDALGAVSSSMIGMSFSWKPRTGWYIPVRGPVDSEHLESDFVLRELKPILENPEIKKVGHNLKYDIQVMRQTGVNVRGVELDTMIAAFLLDPGRMQFGIDRLALDLLNFRKVPTSDLIGKGKTQISMQRIDLPTVAAYASEDADIALRLADLLGARLAEFPGIKKLCDEIETPLIDVLVEMEANGIAVDPSILKEQSKVLGERIEELRAKIFKSACVEFNIDSPKQLQDVLFNRLKLPVGKKTKTGASTDVEVLEKLADKHECPRLILNYRSLTKLKNTYLDNLTDYLNPKTGRIHASFNQIGAATGRLSCSDPNLQNIPIRTDEGRRIRLAFVPGDPLKNVLLTADYSQIELRILAHFTQEPALLKAFEADEDIHRAVAAEVFGVALEDVSRDQRGQAKTINFGIIYGVSAFGLARRIDGMTVQSAQELINSYNKRFPSIQRFLDKCVMEAQSQGYVETISGRRRPIPEVHSPIVSIRNAGERMAINSVVQGSAADLIKIAMNNIHRRLKRENHPSRMLLQVHDELVFETPAEKAESEAAMIKEEMNSAMKLSVPLKVEIGWGKNWQEVK